MVDDEEEEELREEVPIEQQQEQVNNDDVRTVNRALTLRDYDAMPSIGQPKQLSVELLFYQKQGVQWLLNQEKVDASFVGGLLADDMVSKQF